MAAQAEACGGTGFCRAAASAAATDSGIDRQSV
jgi:hypothetical protein